MRQTIDFKDWLSGPSRPRTSYDLYSLWRASCGRSEGQYQAEVRPDSRIRILGPSQEALLLVSPRSINAFKMALEGQSVTPIGSDVWAAIEESKPARIDMKITPGGQKRFR
ncbi:hypothetical protein [Devosia naphthalenivorans]|uniref:hypothetical protein n=1 Tax=Devosia naphthalenivorans TaxID=2082392 RepID=UPI000D3AD75D|nr:hypothetical protein [Devosia naphthalenivorans]